MAEILVCDDDKDIVEAIEIYLTQEGYHILKAYDGEQAIQVLQNNKVDLLIIDVMMPKLDGIRATLKIREKNVLPIIILSAKSEDADKILGLNVGADDYVTKPFNPLELVARVKITAPKIYAVGCDGRKKGKCLQDRLGLRLMMTVKKLRLMAMLSNSHRSNTGFFFSGTESGQSFSINQIYESIWEEEAIAADNTVAVHIRHIREKIEINPKEPRYLKVVWGLGYKVDKI